MVMCCYSNKTIDIGNFISFFAILAMVVGLGGCTTARHPIMPMAKIEGVKRPFFAGQIIRPKPGDTITYEQLINQLKGMNVIFIGEVHDNPDHHLIQVQILQSLLTKWGPFTLAMECLPAKLQPVLDNYLQGNISEQQFLRQVNWQKIWGFDYHFYRPLFQIQKRTGGRIVAINAPQDLIKKIATKGINALSPADRALLPKDMDFTNEAHRKFVHRVYESRAHRGFKRFDYFYQAQCVWEETMAENIARLIKGDNKKVVVISGNGHIIHRFGIPQRLTRRRPVRTATLVPYPVNRAVTLKQDTADFVWLTGRYLHLKHRHRPNIKNEKATATLPVT